MADELQSTNEKGMLVPLPTWAAVPCPRRRGNGCSSECASCNGKGAVKVNIDELKEWKP